ncbi:uncharacterized protein PITG_10500 [Phytophthora infestans T30-4]|uniref:Uncharacterized protein n=1 Tax=Phytophthora infestans (strain T30-4) TaxID=403677 RepID=D0NFG4_PHYIT|nr:uncharacterized protein PITG_10500 [Phytophthora infestans T30-4]EEY56953.1 conserved hypothetical protein [Phytophthora infestans T30-4]|eukprot:XP_002902281.1 conserved hypothetical protein [Phytophthora infestans T30-4]
MWFRRLRALQIFSTIKPGGEAQEEVVYLPFRDLAALRYVYRQIDDEGDGAGAIGRSTESPFRIVDKIRLTKALIDAGFDCGALLERGLLDHHLCPHTHRTTYVDTSLDTDRVQWGEFPAPWRVFGKIFQCYRSDDDLLLHVRNYFGEQLGFYFAFASFHAITKAAVPWTNATQPCDSALGTVCASREGGCTSVGVDTGACGAYFAAHSEQCCASGEQPLSGSCAVPFDAISQERAICTMVGLSRVRVYSLPLILRTEKLHYDGIDNMLGCPRLLRDSIAFAFGGDCRFPARLSGWRWAEACPLKYLGLRRDLGNRRTAEYFCHNGSLGVSRYSL